MYCFVAVTLSDLHSFPTKIPYTNILTLQLDVPKASIRATNNQTFMYL